jgi:hypothetical protein
VPGLAGSSRIDSNRHAAVFEHGAALRPMFGAPSDWPACRRVVSHPAHFTGDIGLVLREQIDERLISRTRWRFLVLLRPLVWRMAELIPRRVPMARPSYGRRRMAVIGIAI